MSFPENYFFIVSRSSDCVLQVKHALQESGATIVTAIKVPDDDWKHESQIWCSQEGFIVNKHSGMVLCVDEYTKFAYQRHTMDFADRWGFDAVDGFIYRLADDSAVLEIQDNGKVEGAHVILSHIKLGKEALNQKWFLQPSTSPIVPTKVELAGVHDIQTKEDNDGREASDTESEHLNYYALFEKRQMYNIPVQMSRHPRLNDHIYDLVAACKPNLDKGIVESISLAIMTQQHAVVERFVFQICVRDASVYSDSEMMKNVTNEDMANENVTEERENILTSSDIDHYFRAFLLKISVCDALLLPNPKDCTFALVVELNEGGEPTQVEPGLPWVPVKHSKPITRREGMNVIPIKSMDVEEMQFRLFVEETRKKTQSCDARE
ncbi:DNA-binding protein [Jimgerdemannia flammicorona]|uniref:DNA-binding protein n=1 Tax=Jimgerdemannia flammicorona TaxID=994334 RepID=A0A433QLX7_9FUNG|nr:DNA-binding protein [Jimgerdemannia flammicorona]